MKSESEVEVEHNSTGLKLFKSRRKLENYYRGNKCKLEKLSATFVFTNLVWKKFRFFFMSTPKEDANLGFVLDVKCYCLLVTWKYPTNLKKEAKSIKIHLVPKNVRSLSNILFREILSRNTFVETRLTYNSI